MERSDHILYHVYTLNPLVAVFQQFRHAMINRATLSAGQLMGSWTALLEPLSLVAVIFVVGFWVFSRAAAAHRRGPVAGLSHAVGIQRGVPITLTVTRRHRRATVEACDWNHSKD